ncbi:hypothetical protein, partial [Xanthomonas oryzae]|uniref:hypothetical protein n=1 Tax=Xanthomonas oryzae TaxID=347 RepID=UPI003CCFEB7C
MAITHKQGLMVGARSFTGTLYDDHTLHEQLEQARILSEDTAGAPKQSPLKNPQTASIARPHLRFWRAGTAS